MKKKIMTISLVVALAAIAIVGGTLAYFTDTDEAVNEFTMGNVKIDLTEPTWVDKAKIVPGDKNTNAVPKDPTVTNIGTEDAYVRIQFAIPLDMVDPNCNAFNDMLHVNFTRASAADGLWSWRPTYTTGDGWTENGLDNNNCYVAEIGDVEHMVYVVTYRTALGAGETTEHPAFYQVYLDKFVNATQNADDTITYTKPFFTDRQGGTESGTMSHTGDFKILVVAEGVQAEGFDNAYDALNEAFGTPGAEGYVSPFNK